MATTFANIYELIQKLSSLDTQGKLLKFCEDNLHYVNCGAFRRVFKTTFANGKIVALKVAINRPYDKGGTASIEQEVKTWKMLKAEDEKFFAELIAYDINNFFWSIVEFVQNEYDGDNFESVSRIGKKYGLNDICNCRNTRSRGDRKPVIVDWGCCH